MEKRKFGKTGCEITALGFGGMELLYLDEKSAVRLLNEVLDQGITYVDTSPEYAKSEYYIGKAIAGRREEYVLATKCGDNMTGRGPLYSFDRETIMSNIDESLRLLKTDHVDILQLHGVIPADFPEGKWEETMEVLDEIRRSGKALHLGLTVCNKGPGMYGFPAGYGYHSILPFASDPRIEVIQLVYGGLTRLSENVIQEAYDRYGTGIVARGILKQYDNSYPAKLAAARLTELCEEGESENDFLVRYSLSHPGLACVLAGTKNIDHLRRNVRMAEKGKLPEEVYQEAKRRLTFAGAIAGPAEMAWQESIKK